jgi:hypothetical protein
MKGRSSIEMGIFKENLDIRQCDLRASCDWERALFDSSIILSIKLDCLDNNRATGPRKTSYVPLNPCLNFDL